MGLLSSWVEQPCANAWRFATLSGDTEAVYVFTVMWRGLASRRFEWRWEKTMEQEFCSRWKCVAGKLRSSEARIFGEHGRAQRRDDFENYLLIRFSHADREMAGYAARAESSFFV